MVFVSPAESVSLPKLLAAAAGKPVLIIGDHEKFAEKGGMINFIKVDGKVRFEVNSTAAA